LLTIFSKMATKKKSDESKDSKPAAFPPQLPPQFHKWIKEGLISQVVVKYSRFGVVMVGLDMEGREVDLSVVERQNKQMKALKVLHEELDLYRARNLERNLGIDMTGLETVATDAQLRAWEVRVVPESLFLLKQKNRDFRAHAENQPVEGGRPRLPPIENAAPIGGAPVPPLAEEKAEEA